MRRLIRWGPAALWATVLFFLSSLPLGPGPGWLPFADKLAHLVLYGVLGGALAWGRRRSAGGGPIAPVASGILYGATDEWHQSFVPGRTPSGADWGADILGVLLGYWIASSILLRLAKGIHEHRPGREPE